MRNRNAIIFDFNRTLYEPDREKLLPRAKNVLNYCFSSYDCFLISYQEEQRSKLIEELGIAQYFMRIGFVEEKNTKNFKDVISRKKYKEVYVVGDRIMGEISIGNSLGFTTVWLKRGKFKNEIPIIDEQRPTFTIYNLMQLKKIL